MQLIESQWDIFYRATENTLNLNGDKKNNMRMFNSVFNIGIYFNKLQWLQVVKSFD